MEPEVAQLRDAVIKRCGEQPFDIAVILGSGLGAFAEVLTARKLFPYADFPCFPPGSVAGHAGNLVAGTIGDRRLLVFQGRHHLYEGYDARTVTVTVRVAAALGAHRLFLTNAVGGINAAYQVGDFMFIADHINLLGDNPLRGERRNPFIDLTDLYSQDLYPPLSTYARELGGALHRGVLAALPGPSYETPAEIHMLSRLGADAVSMSTIPEAIMGRYLGMEVAGISLVSNAAAGLGNSRLSHAEVLEAGRRGAENFCRLLQRMVELW